MSTFHVDELDLLGGTEQQVMLCYVMLCYVMLCYVPVWRLLKVAPYYIIV